MSAGDEPVIDPPLIRAARVECRFANDPILETSCDYWPYDLGEPRADELARLHEGHPVGKCLVQLAVMARIVEPRNGPRSLGRSMYLTAVPDDWAALVAADQPLTRRVTVLPDASEILGLLLPAHTQGNVS